MFISKKWQRAVGIKDILFDDLMITQRKWRIGKILDYSVLYIYMYIQHNMPNILQSYSLFQMIRSV